MSTARRQRRQASAAAVMPPVPGRGHELSELRRRARRWGRRPGRGNTRRSAIDEATR